MIMATPQKVKPPILARDQILIKSRGGEYLRVMSIRDRTAFLGSLRDGRTISRSVSYLQRELRTQGGAWDVMR